MADVYDVPTALGEDTIIGENRRYTSAETVPSLSEHTTQLHSKQLTKVETNGSKQELVVFSRLKDTQTSVDAFEYNGRTTEGQGRCHEGSGVIAAMETLFLGDPIGKHRPVMESLLLPDRLLPDQESSDVSTTEQVLSDPDPTIGAFGCAYYSSHGLLERAAQGLRTTGYDVPDADGTQTTGSRLPPSQEDPRSCTQDNTALETLQVQVMCGTAPASNALTPVSATGAMPLQPLMYDTDEESTVVQQSSPSQPTSSTQRLSTELSQSNLEIDQPDQQDGAPNPARRQEEAGLLDFFLTLGREVQTVLKYGYVFFVIMYTLLKVCEYPDWYSAHLVMLIICHRNAFFL
ncbi:hypothetical protein MRX96_033516 [Rhipicephalus microplus]|uniref:Uncharacterized protein n=1 Tax=Rhipicephalus microplus TaxID=6941 RepID=A0A9J6EB47_RHIMP|nr:hypothetical protein HPB51_015228 [Rhipicephalus microplus]